MSHFLDIAVGTLVMRPYVFAFFTAYLFAAVPHLGWKKVLSFTLVGYLIAFSSEFASINCGFPYGWYYYIDTTSSRELWIAGVPFFDSLSYVFLAYCSYTVALLILSPVERRGLDLVTVETGSIRRSFSVLLLASLLQVFLDIIIDPVSLQGRRWFLGQIYGYREVGIHFGVPLSNYLGWWLVSAFMIGALQIIDRTLGRCDEATGTKWTLPFRSLLGPVLYLSVVLFNLAVAVWIGERLIALTGAFIMFLPTVMTVLVTIGKVRGKVGEGSRS